ncbi:MAG: methyl-accepting chemotaxis protein [Pseudomonadota bacterium]
MRIRDIRIGVRVSGAFFIVVLLSALVGAVGWQGLRVFQDGVRTVTITQAFFDDLGQVRALLLRFDQSADDALAGQIRTLIGNMNDRAGDFADSDDLGDALRDFENSFAAYQAALLAHRGANATAEEALTQITDDSGAIVELIKQSHGETMKRFQAAAAQGRAMREVRNVENAESLRSAGASLRDNALQLSIDQAMFSAAISDGERQAASEIVEQTIAALRQVTQELDRNLVEERSRTAIMQFSEFLESYPGQFAALRRAGQDRMAAQDAFNANALAVIEAANGLKTRSENVLAAAANRSEQWILFGVLGAVIGGALLSWRINRSIVRPVGALTAAMTTLASDQTDIVIPGTDRGDEFGRMAQTVEVFRNSAVKRQLLEQQQESSRLEAEQEKRQTLDRLAGDFEQSVLKLLDDMAHLTDDMAHHATDMTGMAGETSDRMAGAASQSNQAMQNVETVASTAEQLSASIAEVARQAANCLDDARVTSEEAAHTQQGIAELSESAGEIGRVLQMIRDIAEQTNLLALNATIEAARAGDAGKGFAVVAGEVKNLATQSARATEEIAGLVDAIQRKTSASVDSIAGITGHIRELENRIGSVVAATDEQKAATAEIATNVDAAARAARVVSSETNEASHKASETGHKAAEVSESAGTVAQNARHATVTVSEFITRLRAG